MSVMQKEVGEVSKDSDNGGMTIERDGNASLQRGDARKGKEKIKN